MRKLTLKKEVSDKWLERCDDIIIDYFGKIKRYFDEENIYDSDYEIQSFIFYRFNSSNLQNKYALIIKEVLSKFQCVGIWKRSMVLGTVEPIIVLKVYGYKPELKALASIFDYLINGIDRYYDVHVSKLRKKSHVRRVMRKKLNFKLDARRRTNLNIQNKLDKLYRRLLSTDVIFNVTEKKGNTKIERIIKEIQIKEKIDYKNYRGMKTPSLKSMYSRKSKIEINRLV